MNLVISSLITVFFLLTLFRFFFDNLQDFGSGIISLITPNVLSIFRNSYDDDRINSFKVIVYFAIAFGAGLLTYSVNVQ
jgi:hypothetical protein